ncbi:MAG: NAD(P)-binding domain-containing protein [Planctomycetota bacterium]
MISNPISIYTKWLHTRWPAGKPEKLPVVNDDGSTNVPGFYIVGDLTGIPLLKFSADTGTRAVRTITNDASFGKRNRSDGDVLDIAIVGAGVSGFAAAKESEKLGLKWELFEASQPFSTIANFPKGKPIFTYPTDMTPAGDLQFHEKAEVKEGLIEDLHEQTLDLGIEPTKARIEKITRSGGVFELDVAGGDNVRAHRVIVGIGRSGNFRKLGVPGEDLDKVYNRLHDPKDFCGKHILVVGGGDSAMETAIALATCGSRVTLSYRKPEFSRPKPENIEKLKSLAANPDADVEVETVDGDRVTTPSGAYLGPKPQPPGTVNLMMASKPVEITEDRVVIKDADGNDQAIENEAVFSMIGREPPLDFFRKSGVRVSGDRGLNWWVTLTLFFAFCFWMYHWKGNKPLFGVSAWKLPDWLVWDPAATWAWLLGALGQPIQNYFASDTSVGGVVLESMGGKSFYYTLAYASCVVIFGLRRIRRRKTPYIKVQTYTLMAIQVVPLFLLPEIILPVLGAKGAFDAGFGAWLADTFFPEVSYGHGREYWRAYGLILAWPLMAWNWFTHDPIWGWLILGFLQTFVAIPAMIYFWGKGAYCGWICSCGALAETLGDTHRHKMPHGPFWNRLNMTGQVFLVFAGVLMVMRIVGWALPDGNAVAGGFSYAAEKVPLVSYAWLVDLMWAGVIGVGLYFWFSGRVWCRFACPLAALMHIYTRLFSRFAIIPEKKKCISCNVCTSVCHQGIDIMNFANKGLPMVDVECVRCSACVQSCPTGVLSFGQIDRKTGNTLKKDPSWLAASPVQIAELTVNGKPSLSGLGISSNGSGHPPTPDTRHKDGATSEREHAEV